ncbi:hypothetical protein DPMN_127384 [Dreissena polymorpha]|uniref:Uncharacterized protein n=1 Tax=Dreissena polymorpha TaxID=45954 RepID=A0A9D4GZ50_DREPO|nr:hypothetical protein DPMN_127384 [Dreissena polymorpha]
MMLEISGLPDDTGDANENVEQKLLDKARASSCSLTLVTSSESTAWGRNVLAKTGVLLSRLQIPKPGSGFSAPGSPLEKVCLYKTLLRRSARSCPSKFVHLSATTNSHRPGLLVVISTGYWC